MNRPVSRLLAASALALCVLQPVALHAQPADESRVPVTLQADNLTYDERLDTVTATGNVELTQGPLILLADRVVYNRRTDVATATGNVSYLDDTGDVYFGEYLELSDGFRDGLALGVSSLLADNSRFVAARGRLTDGTVTEFEDAAFTPCEICEEDPDAQPLWQIRAGRIIHDRATRDVHYRDAWVEVGGIPVAWTPYFSHPDPSVERRSGFLTPSAGWKEELGGFARSYYYLDIAPERDATIELMASTLQGLLLGAEWRERFGFGELIGSGAVTRADQRTGPAQSVTADADEYRGYLFADARFNVSRRWRAGAQIRYTSDDTFLKLYDYSEDDVLVTRAFAEGFHGDSYIEAEAFGVDDIRPGIRADQPTILPRIRRAGRSDAGAVLGGTARLDADFLSVVRDGGQDVRRWTADAAWHRRWIAPIGLVTALDAQVQNALYWVQEADPGGGSSDGTFLAGQSVPQVRISARLPLVRPVGPTDLLLEPIIAFDTAPTVIGESTDIPNEDSRDVELDATSLFRINRFPGRDRIEDGTRLTWGLRAGLYGQGGGASSLFFGQSYRFNRVDLFPEGSGLNGALSDFVGRLDISPGRLIDIDYRFRLDSDTLDSRLHELNLTYGNRRNRIGANYVFVSEVAGTGIAENRNELTLSGRTQLSEFWSAQTMSRTTLGGDARLLETRAIVTYQDECFLFSVNLTQDFTDPAGDLSGSSIFFRFGLKSIGEFDSPEFF